MATTSSEMESISLPSIPGAGESTGDFIPVSGEPLGAHYQDLGKKIMQLHLPLEAPFWPPAADDFVL